MIDNLLKSATLALCLVAAQPAHAGFSSVFGPLKTMTVSVTGSLPERSSAFCISTSAGAFALDDLSRALGSVETFDV
ncbi:hypothetical protein EYW49_02440 [Siculibacillus lacustris]|uniref:Uncharacterized protein n=1 Tax=Siculibacillus lacustris TaxID=1549641 RepID=A0A4Q9VYD4_9HYPH|nr:hypothetical protein [Siculibacillus lacustris]TBW41032.1 hypothetical protein EYW49_02440 [Siculibacillus lacustris]